MKLAYLINQYPKVSHTFIRTEILALEELGHRVERIAVRGWDAELVDPLDRAERERTRYVLKDGAGPLLVALAHAAATRPVMLLSALRKAWKLSRQAERGLLYHLVYLVEACQVLRWLRASGAEHVHAHFGSNAATVALLVKKLGGPPFSFTIHGSEEFDKPLQWKLSEKIAASSAVVTISSFCRSQVYRWAKLSDWRKIGIAHCAIDPSFADAPSTPPPANHRLVCVGRLCEQKGQLLLLEAVAKLRARGVPVELVLAGDGEMRPEVEAAIATAGLTECVSITGWVSADEVRELLDGARALVLPSFAEGLPVVIMEAMARQRPVLSTYIGGIPELVRDGREGALVPAGDLDALTEGMERVLTMTPEALSAMGEAARTRALERHDSRTEAGKVSGIIAGAHENTLPDWTAR